MLLCRLHIIGLRGFWQADHMNFYLYSLAFQQCDDIALPRAMPLVGIFLVRKTATNMYAFAMSCDMGVHSRCRVNHTLLNSQRF